MCNPPFRLNIIRFLLRHFVRISLSIDNLDVQIGILFEDFTPIKYDNRKCSCLKKKKLCITNWIYSSFSNKNFVLVFKFSSY